MFNGVRNFTYEERLTKLNLMSTETRRKRGDIIMTYRILTNSIVIDENIFHVSTESRTRGHDLRLSKKTMTSDLRVHFFSNRVVDEWNGLGQKLVQSPNVQSFKLAYDHHNNNQQRCKTRACSSHLLNNIELH